MVEDKNKFGRRSKIATATFLAASVALVASFYIFKEDDIFINACDKNELRRIWMEYNRKNHPDKCTGLNEEDLLEHMKTYHKTKERYENLRDV